MVDERGGMLCGARRVICSLKTVCPGLPVNLPPSYPPTQAGLASQACYYSSFARYSAALAALAGLRPCS